MANMTFGVNIIPKDDTVSLGTSQNKWKINGVDDPKLTDTTYSEATTSTAGLMSATDKSKLDGIAAGAQVNSITGIKGNAESSYRTGNVNLTAENVGAMPSTAVLTPSAAFPIPTSGNSVSYNLTGITASHQLIRWNFSFSAENAPPANLSWDTENGYFTITNNGGITAQSIKPVFALSNAVATTNH